jgi:hypothetical protein
MGLHSFRLDKHVLCAGIYYAVAIDYNIQLELGYVHVRYPTIFGAIGTYKGTENLEFCKSNLRPLLVSDGRPV